MAAMSEGRNKETFLDPEEKKCVVSALYIATTKMCENQRRWLDSTVNTIISYMYIATCTLYRSYYSR